MKKCPHCAEEIQDDAIVCRYCHRDIAPSVPAPGLSLTAPLRRRQIFSMLAIGIGTVMILAGNPFAGIGVLLLWGGIAVGMPVGGRLIRVGGGFLLTLIAFAVLYEPTSTPARSISTSNRASTAAASTTTIDRKPSVTMATYNQLSTGMTYEAAVAILGPGTEISRSDLAGTTTVMYQWTGRGLANMNAMFQNNALISKAQFGLQ